MNLIYFSEEPQKQLLIPDGNFNITGCKNEDEALTLISKGSDLLIIDFSNNSERMEKFCKLIRRNNWTLPVLIIGQDKEIVTKVLLLNAGADDYLEKPYDYQELIARIKALHRRPKCFHKKDKKNNYLELDNSKQSVILKGNHIPLTKKEFLILEYFISRPNELISRSNILEHAWGLNANPFSKSIEMHILNLRKKINNNEDSFIQTVSGRGYIFNKRSNKK